MNQFSNIDFEKLFYSYFCLLEWIISSEFGNIMVQQLYAMWKMLIYARLYSTKKCSYVIASYFGSSLTFRPEDGSEFAAVNLEGDILEDNSDPDASNQLLEAGPGLYLNKYNFYIIYFVFNIFLSVQ